jgi:hypothetical protein
MLEIFMLLAMMREEMILYNGLIHWILHNLNYGFLWGILVS